MIEDHRGGAMSILVRRASKADAEAISRLNADVQAVHAAALPGWFKPPSASTFPPAEAAELIEGPDSLVFLAELGSEPAGYAYAEVIRRPEEPWREAFEMAYLEHISVRPEFRRKGVGAALIGAWRAGAAELGITLLGLDVWSFNEDARRFFRRHGFTAYNERLWNR
jgi:ribosomal protein S18 acetylase RimI-like enzyme